MKKLTAAPQHKLNNGFVKLKGVAMSNEEAEALMDSFEKWDAKHAKQDFIHRMERKLGRKQLYSRK